MAIEVRELRGSVINNDFLPTSGYVFVRPVGVTPAHASQGVVTYREKRWTLEAGELPSDATIAGGCNYEFTVFDATHREVLRFTAGVSNVAGSVSLESLYLSAVVVDTVDPNAVLEGDDVDVLLAPSGTTEGHTLTVGPSRSLVFAAPSSASATITKTAAEALSGRRAVALNSSSEAIYADKDAAGQQARVLGITTGAASLGATATIQTQGIMTEVGWTWNPLLPIYLGDNGALTQTPPTTGGVVQLAVPLSATSIYINIKTPLIRA